MNKTGIVVFFGLLTSCHSFQPKEGNSENPIARVNEAKLFPSDLVGLIPSNSTVDDSIRYTQKYVNDWVRKQLIIDKARSELDLNEAEIDQKVRDYRFALTRSAFEKQYIDKHLDENISDEEIQEYYQNHSEDFILKQNIVRCIFTQVPMEAPQKNRFEKNMRAYPKSDKDDLKNHATQFANRAHLDDSVWVDFDEVIGGTPFELILNKNRILRTRTYLQESDETYDYYLRILEYMTVDDISPLEFVRKNIIDILINKRKIALKKELEDKIYNEAIEKNAFEIFDN